MQAQSNMRSSTSTHERESNDGASDGSNSTRREGSTATSLNGNGNSHKKRKKNATMACNTCRRKRNRCIVDEGASLCRGCKASGQDCQFAEFDKRRDGIQELREKLSFYESMFETLQNGSNSRTESGRAGHNAASAAVDQAMHDHPHLDEGFDFLSNSNNGNGNAFAIASSSSSSNSNTLANANNPSNAAFFEQANNGPSDASIALTRTPQSTENNNGPVTTGPTLGNAAMNGDAYEGPAHPHSRPSASATHPSTHRRVSGRTPDMLAVMDHLAVESNGLIRAYGATSETALAGFEDLPSQKTVYSTRRYHSVFNTKEPPREVTPPADVQPLQSSALAAAANNITALPLGTDIRTVQHLLHLYFLWAWPMFPVISRQIFMQHFTNGGQYYSPLLLNALLALASHLSDWKVVRAQSEDPYTAGNTFFDMAKSLLEDELERPSVTTVQALLLMAKREAYCGRPLRGGLYIAMCGRLVLDLGLHLDCLHLLDRGILTETDRYVRSVTFWGIWSVDKEYSAMVGRPCNIRNVVITCPKPGYWALEDFSTSVERLYCDRYKLNFSPKSPIYTGHFEDALRRRSIGDWWEAYRTGQISPTPVSLSEPWKGPCTVARAALDMAGIHLRSMERLHWGETQTSTIEHSRNLETSMAETRAAMALLPNLNTALAQGLVPHAITLTMTYHCHIIIINRPFLFDDPEERASRPPSAAGGLEDTPRKRCFHSAQELIRLIDMFRSMTPSGIQPTLNCHQHNVVIAAAILIFQVTSVTGTFIATYESRIANECLQRAFVILAEMAAHRPAARQALANLKNSFDQRRRREARLTQGASPSVQQSTSQKAMNPFGYSPNFLQSEDSNTLLDSYTSAPLESGQSHLHVNSEHTFNAGTAVGHNVPSFGIMDSGLHAPLFYSNDGPLDDFSDLDSFLAQHSGYLYSADLLQSFPGGSS